jgi:hypothetical protein
MKGKVLFVVGMGVGYVLGTRAGRRRYEQIKSAWLHVWESPTVQKQVHSAQDYAADRIGDLGSLVTENIKRAVTKPRESKPSDSESAGSTSATAQADAMKAGAATAQAGAANAGAARKPGRSKRSGAPGSGGQAS